MNKLSSDAQKESPVLFKAEKRALQVTGTKKGTVLGNCGYCAHVEQTRIFHSPYTSQRHKTKIQKD